MVRRRKEPRRDTSEPDDLPLLSPDMFDRAPLSSLHVSRLHSHRREEKERIAASLASDAVRADALRLKLHELQVEFDTLNREITQKQYALSAVGVLPPELLGEVFEYAVCDNELTALIMGQVCRTWRKVITASPRVWSTIHIRLSRRNPELLAAMYFEKSKACALHVIISDPPLEWKFSPPLHTIEPYVQMLQSNWNRVRIFRMYRVGGQVAKAFLQGCIVPVEDVPSPMSSQSLASAQSTPSSLIIPRRPIARHIALNLAPNHSIHEESDMADFRCMSSLFGDAQDVTTLCIENGLPSYNMPLFTSGKLKSIQIDEPHMYGYSTPVDRVLEILAMSPELQIFIFAGNKSTRNPPCPIRLHSLIHLPVLRILSLQSLDIPVILNHIVCPILEKLKLGNELAVRWDGCVAKSLRQMIIRSKNSGITRLRINEIATPSLTAINEWECFDVMPQLQSFRCHHTHFPDDLLRKLNGQPRVVNGETLPPLCPKLSKLVFENCDFSGQALVDFVKARSAASVELSELWAGQCPRVEEDHQKQLKVLLGTRFQASLLANRVE